MKQQNKKIKTILLLSAFPMFLLGLSACDSTESQSPSEESELIKINNIQFEDKEVVYNGEKHSIFVEGVLPSDIEVEYTNNGQINAGEYEVTAKFVGDETKYELPEDMVATLTINKATYDMSNISFKDSIVEYNGEIKSIEIEGNLPEGVTVSYTNNNQTEIGTYEVVANFASDNSNYYEIAPLKAKLSIVKAGDVPVLFENESFSYDGTNKSIYIEGNLPEGVTVSYYNNEQSKPGTYEVIATFTSTNPNYVDIPDKKAILTIVKDGKYHDVLFSVNGETKEEYVVQNGNVISQVPSLPQDKEGYTHAWEYNGEEITQDLVVNNKYVANTYQVIFNLDGGKLDCSYQEVIFDGEYILPTPQKEGHTFVGWLYEEKLIDSKGKWEKPSNIEVQALWRDNSLPKQSINYYIGDELVKSESVFYGDVVSIYNPEIQKPEYIFVSWSTENNNYYAEDKFLFLFKESVNLYAQYMLDYSFFEYSILNDEITIDRYLGKQENLMLDENVLIDEKTYKLVGISSNAFANNDTLKTIYIPSSVVNIGNYAFSGCKNLSDIKVDKNNIVYDSREESDSIVETQTNKIIATCTTTTIPSTVQTIGEGAFYSTYKEEIIIPRGVKLIENYAFANSSTLRNVRFMSGGICKEIGKYAFTNSTNLETVDIPESIEVINEDAFLDSQIKNINYLGKIVSWFDIRFMNTYSNPLSCNAKLYVDEELVKELVVPSGVKVINHFAFVGYNELTSLTFEENSECYTIGNFAFYNCKNLKLAIIPKSVSVIGKYAVVGVNDGLVLCEHDEKPITWEKTWTSSLINVSWNFVGEKDEEMFEKYSDLLLEYKSKMVNIIKSDTKLSKEYVELIRNKILSIKMDNAYCYITDETIVKHIYELLVDDVDYLYLLSTIQSKENDEKDSYSAEWFNKKFIETNPLTNKTYLTYQQLQEATNLYMGIIEKYNWEDGNYLSIEQLKELYEKEQKELKVAMEKYENIYWFENKKHTSQSNFETEKEQLLLELDNNYYPNLTVAKKEAIVLLIKSLEMKDLTNAESLEEILKEEKRVYDIYSALNIIIERENEKKELIKDVNAEIDEKFSNKFSTKEIVGIKEELTYYIDNIQIIDYEKINKMSLFERIEYLNTLSKEKAEKTYLEMDNTIEETFKKYAVIADVQDYYQEIIKEIAKSTENLSDALINDYSYKILKVGSLVTIPTDLSLKEVEKLAGEKTVDDKGQLSYQNTTEGHVGKINLINKEVKDLCNAMKVKDDAIQLLLDYLQEETGLSYEIVAEYIEQIKDLGDAEEINKQMNDNPEKEIIKEYLQKIDDILLIAEKHHEARKAGYLLDKENSKKINEEINRLFKYIGSCDVMLIKENKDIMFGEVTIVIDGNGKVVFASYTDNQEPTPNDNFYHDGSFKAESGKVSSIFKFSENFEDIDEDSEEKGYEFVLPENGFMVTGTSIEMKTIISISFNQEDITLEDNSFFENYPKGTNENTITIDDLFSTFTKQEWNDFYAAKDKLLKDYSAQNGKTEEEAKELNEKFQIEKNNLLENIRNQFIQIDKNDFSNTFTNYKNQFENIVYNEKNNYPQKATEILELRAKYLVEFRKVESSYEVKELYEQFKKELQELIEKE